MILGVRAAVYVPSSFEDGMLLFRDKLQFALSREYMAGAKERKAHGSPSWAEIPGANGGMGVVIAAQGVFGPDPVTGPAFLLESDDPAADAADLATRGFTRIGDIIHDAWWHDIAVLRGPDNLTIILCSFTGRLHHRFDQEFLESYPDATV
jgi:hypothetical protein